MAKVKPSLTLDVNLHSNPNTAIGGSGTAATPRAYHNAVANKANAQIAASALGPEHLVHHIHDVDLDIDHHDHVHVDDRGGFSSDDDAQDVYAAATMRLRAGSASAGAKATRDQNHIQQQQQAQQQQQQQQQQQRRQYSRYASGNDSDSSLDGDDYAPAHARQRTSQGLHEQIMYDQDDQIHIHQHQMHDDDQEEDEDEEEDDGELSSSPSIPDENIDFDLVYALHNFIATIEGQATVHKGNSLTLLDDSNSYWWLVRVLRTQEVGYIPAENIETPFERLARLNKHRNVDLTSATDEDHIQVPERIFTSHLVKARNAAGNAGLSAHSGKLSALSRRAHGAPEPLSREARRNKRGVIFGPSTYVEHTGPIYTDSDEFDEDEDNIMELDEDDADEYGHDHDHDHEDEDEDEDEQHDAQHEYDDNMGSDDERHHNAFARMEPDDGMEWDAAETERVQREQEARSRGAAAAAAFAPQQQYDRQQEHEAQSQQRSAAAAAAAAAPATRLAQHSSIPASLEPGRGPSPHPNSISADVARQQQQEQQQQQQQEKMFGQQQQQQQQYGLTVNQQRQDHMRNSSADRPISSLTSIGLVAAHDQQARTSIHSSSSSSTGGFLPSELQAQRERSTSDASNNPPNGNGFGGGDMLSPVTSPDAQRSSKDEKRKSNRRSKMEDSSDNASEEKSIKKRSGVFSLFSRSKDKKDRKSGSFGTNDERDSIMAGRNSEDSFSSSSRNRASASSPANPANPLAAANAGLSPGQSLGMGRAVQERDRAQQEAYTRQFLSGNSSLDSSMSRFSADQSPMLSSRTGKPARPGSLIGPSDSTPMLSVLRVFAGDGIECDSTFKTVLLNESTKSADLHRQALQRFGVPLHERDQYVLTIKRLEGDERPLKDDEQPLQLFNALTAMLHEGQVTVPSVKRSSVGSISSIASNLSTHPAIARLGNDFSDDHAVKFYICRKDRLLANSYHQHAYASDAPAGRAGAGAAVSGAEALRSGVADDSGASWNQSDVTESQDLSHATGLSLTRDGQRSSHSSMVSAETADTVQGPTARFSLRLVIYATDLPEGLVFDPQTNALIPKAALDERAQQYREPAEGISQHAREKILTFPRNTTVAEVVEAGLDRFGIAEGVVEGGDDVEDRPSRRKSRLHIKYGLAVVPHGEAGAGAGAAERALAPTSRILDAYTTLPTFRNLNKRRSIDAAMLLGAQEDIAPTDPVFVLRSRQSVQAKWKGHSLAENALLAKQQQQQQQQQQGAAAAAAAAAADGSGAMTRQDLIAAQRAAARALVLETQANAADGVDVVLSDKARLRSSRIGSDAFRYSYMPVSGEERDVTGIVEEVLATAPLTITKRTGTGTGTAGSAGSGDLLDRAVREGDEGMDAVVSRVRMSGSAASGTLSTDRGETMTPPSSVVADDVALDQMYTIVHAAARRAPTPAPLPRAKTEAGLFATTYIGHIEYAATRDAYAPIDSILGTIDDTLDQLLMDAMRVF